jgi:thymidylate synthase
VFSIRTGFLHVHAIMRSSDAWLGIPYDMFSFACVGLRVLCLYNERQPIGDLKLLPGALTFSLTSSHLYERDLEKAKDVLASPPSPPVEPVGVCCGAVLREGRWDTIATGLEAQRDKQPMSMGWKVTL